MENVIGQMRTSMAQITLCICTVRWGPSLSAIRIIWYFRMYEWNAKARMILCPCAVWCEFTNFAHVRRHFFTWCGLHIFCNIWEDRTCQTIIMKTLVMLNKLRCHTRFLIQIYKLNGKQCILKKPTDLDLHCLQRKGISGFSRTRVNRPTWMYVSEPLL